METNSYVDNLEQHTDTKKYAHLMNFKFKVYTYITADNEAGTLIMHPDLRTPFDKQMLFEMDSIKESEISLLDILEKGFIKFGSADLMDNMDIQYPLIENDRYTQNKITGRHWNYHLSEIAQVIGKEFVIEDNTYNSASGSDLESESESYSDSDRHRDNDKQDNNDCSPSPPCFISLDSADYDVECKPCFIDSVLKDEDMNIIFDKLEKCEEYATQHVDNLMKEFEL